MNTLRVGDPLDKSTDVGAIVAPVQLERIKRLVEAGEREGAHVWRAPCALPACGWFYPPTLVTGVEPASILAREEIFGPVLAAMTFRTPDEAIALANNTRYGLAASVWTENVNRALEVAARIKAGVVWINSTNMFDAASGFGGYRESGFGREGGREGLAEYRVARRPKAKTDKAAGAGAQRAARAVARPSAPTRSTAPPSSTSAASRRGPTPARSYAVLDPSGREARARRRSAIARTSATPSRRRRRRRPGARRRRTIAPRCSITSPRTSQRAGGEFADRLRAMTGAAARAAEAEVDASIRRAFFYAGFADKFDGAVHATAIALRHAGDERAVGRHGHRLPDEAPLLAFVSLVMPAIAMGNCVVAIPSAAIRSARPTSIRCSTRPTFPPASSTSSPARRRRSPRRSPNTTASTPCGASVVHDI